MFGWHTIDDLFGYDYYNAEVEEPDEDMERPCAINLGPSGGRF
jgi:hypothetical protein